MSVTPFLFYLIVSQTALFYLSDKQKAASVMKAVSVIITR